MQHCRGGGITSELDRGRGTFLRPDVEPTATALPLVGSVAWEPFPRRSVQPVNGTEVSRMSHDLSSYLGGLVALLCPSERRGPADLPAIFPRGCWWR
jgi:hypothetical protein